MKMFEKENVSEKSSVYSIDIGNHLKRFMAFIIDTILLVIMTVGVMSIVSAVTKYDEKYSIVEEQYKNYGVRLTADEVSKLEDTSNIVYLIEIEKDEKGNDKEVQVAYNVDWEAFQNDENAYTLYVNCQRLVFVNIAISTFVAMIILEFAVPMLLKNGRTVGSWSMHVGLIGIDRLRIKPAWLFARCLIGRWAIETMVPVYCFIFSLYFGPSIFTLIPIILIIGEILCLILSKYHVAIHDLVSCCICVDLDTQFIPDTVAELEAKLQKEKN